MPISARPVALVTGGRRGIGAAIVTKLAQSGCDVITTDIGYTRDEHARVTHYTDASNSRKAQQLLSLQHDVASIESTREMLENACRWKGRIDILVNNAGVGSPCRGDLLNITPEAFDFVNSINLRGTFFITQLVAKEMLKNDSHTRTIINISSVSATIASIDRSEYCISKSAVSMMTKLFSVRLAKHNISVFEIRPGIIRTEMTSVASDKYEKMFKEEKVPMSRWGEPEEIGKAVALLTSGDVAFSTGSIMSVDGGLSIHRL